MVIWCSRNSYNSHYNQRFLRNEKELIRMLQNIYGKRFLIFDHLHYNLDETFDLFAKAQMIIGIHGGSLYNQFLSSVQTIIVEIMPVRNDGRYPDQSNLHQQPSFSHMSIWSNSLLIGQPFYRFYLYSELANYHRINLNLFKDFLLQIPGIEQNL